MKIQAPIILAVAATVFAFTATQADVVTTTANNGNLIMEDMPAIPAEIVESLNRYQNVRSAAFREWTEDGQGIYVSTRFGDVSQIHRVDMPGGARTQITFYDEPIGGVQRQPQGSKLTFTRDAGGSEFSQIFMLDPADGSTTMLTDGESRNGAFLWDRGGRRIAFQSTRRNGASNDVWLMDPEDKDSARVVLESPDGTWWGPVEFSESGSKLLIMNYVSIADSRVHLLDLDSETYELLAGGEAGGGANFPLGFAADDDGFWLTTDRGGEFTQLAWQPAEPGAEVEIVTGDIPWNIGGAAISHDRRSIAFTANENGLYRIYLILMSLRSASVRWTMANSFAGPTAKSAVWIHRRSQHHSWWSFPLLTR